MNTENDDNQKKEYMKALTTDIRLPGEEFVVDHWIVGDGSVVRKGDTLAVARRRSATGEIGGQNNVNARNVAAATSAPVHKRPNRRRRPQPNTTTSATASSSATASKPINSATNSSSTALSLKGRLAAKLAAKKGGESNKNEGGGDTTASESTSSSQTTIPIISPATGILRANKSNPSTDLDEQSDSKSTLCIGYIEECLHPTIFDGMCVVCGNPAKKSGRNNDPTSSSSSLSAADNNVSQVTVSGGITMTVSQQESEQMALLDSERLFGQRRLSLVLDLDHTLVHATSDVRARQYVTLNNTVRAIRLPLLEGADPSVPVDPSHVNMWALHHVKLRPHLSEFFNGVQSMYEITVYTAGTRQYAEEITMIICRSLVGSDRDIDDLERFRHQVKMAEAEYAKHSQLKDDEEVGNKRKADGMDEVDDEDGARPGKRKKVSFGFSESVEYEGTSKSDHITKEQLERMQSDLREADDLEQKARGLRQKLFGSRVFSRTDVGDLGRDVKSLKRIFPCGGTMAAVVDDREDVWANAKDNITSTVKGEPPENLLLVRPYHWQPFVGFADINNSAGADLSGSRPKDSDPNNESDFQLLWTKEILQNLHARYYQQSADGKRRTVPYILKGMRREVLKGSTLVLSGLVPLHKQSTGPNTARPPIVRYAQSLGAKVSIDDDISVSFLSLYDFLIAHSQNVTLFCRQKTQWNTELHTL
jgi:RNA polymerase II subunit A-like phosphatase